MAKKRVDRPWKSVCVTFRAGRVLAGYTQQELAEICGIKPQTVSRFENGCRVLKPNLEKITAAIKDAGILFLYDGRRLIGVTYKDRRAGQIAMRRMSSQVADAKTKGFLRPAKAKIEAAFKPKQEPEPPAVPEASHHESPTTLSEPSGMPDLCDMATEPRS